MCTDCNRATTMKSSSYALVYTEKSLSGAASSKEHRDDPVMKL